MVGGGTDSSRDAGAPSYGGQSYVNTGIYSGAVSTSFTLTVPAAVTGNVVGIAGTVKITDRAGTTTYTALGPSSHIVT